MIVYLEYRYLPTGACPAAMGSDAATFIDGRWSRWRQADAMRDAAARYLSTRRREPTYELVGYSRPGDWTVRDIDTGRPINLNR